MAQFQPGIVVGKLFVACSEVASSPTRNEAPTRSAKAQMKLFEVCSAMICGQRTKAMTLRAKEAREREGLFHLIFRLLGCPDSPSRPLEREEIPHIPR